MLRFAYDLSYPVLEFVGSAPVLLVAIGGLVVCVFRRSRAARVRTFIGGAIVFLSAAQSIPRIWYAGLVEFLPAAADGTTFLRTSVYHLIPSVLIGVSLLLLFRAAMMTDVKPRRAFKKTGGVRTS
jgi:hypothetical protein